MRPAERDPQRHRRVRRRPTSLLQMAALALLLGGCVRHTAVSIAPSTPAAVPVGSSSQTVVVGGRNRTFDVYRPAALPAAAPLVLFLHGGYGTGSQAERSYGWDAEADQHHFVVAYPDGLDRAWNGGGGCCGQPAAQHVDDVAFLTAVVTTLERELPVDHRAVYATGISNGGIMAFRLACDTSLFAAIGPDSATMLGSCPSPHPVSVIQIHGTADTRIPYDGGPGKGSAHIDGPSVPSVNATWRGIDGCAPPSATTAGVVTTSSAACPDGRTVELITIAGAGHQWPGGVNRPVIDRVLGLDPPSQALDATDTVWAFFAAHPQPAA